LDQCDTLDLDQRDHYCSRLRYGRISFFDFYGVGCSCVLPAHRLDRLDDRVVCGTSCGVVFMDARVCLWPKRISVFDGYDSCGVPDSYRSCKYRANSQETEGLDDIAAKEPRSTAD